MARRSLAPLFHRSPALQAAPAVIGVLIADWLLLSMTPAAGYAKPLVLACFMLCSVFAVLNVYAALGILFLVASVDGLLKAWFGGGMLALLMKDYFVGLCLIGWLSGRSWQIRRPGNVRMVIGAMVALAVWVGLQILNPNAQLLASIAGARAWLIWLPVFIITYDVVTTPEQVQRYVAWLVFIGTLVGIHGLAQYFLGVNFLGALPEESTEVADRYAWWSPTEGKQTRVFGTTVHPARYGGLMGFGVLLGVGFAVQRRGAAVKVLMLIAVGIMGCGLMLSGSRTPIVGAFVGSVAAVLSTRHIRLAVGILAFAAVGIIAAGEMTQGLAYERVASLWREPQYTKHRPLRPLRSALAMSVEHPLGLGLDSGVGVPYRLRFDLRRRGHFLENAFARALGELGWPGLFIYTTLVASILWLAVASVRAAHAGPHRYLAAALFGVVALQLTGTATGTVMYPTPGAILFFACLAFLARLRPTDALPTDDVAPPGSGPADAAGNVSPSQPALRLRGDSAGDGP